MFAQADYSPSSSPEALSRVNGFINRAYNQLALEAPFLFFESKVYLTTEPDASSKAGGTDNAGNAVTDTIRLAGANTGMGATNDPWTWRTTFTSVQQGQVPEGLTAWNHDRSWDGRMIEITATDGTRLRNQIRSVWHNTSDNYYYFTLVTPWDIGTYGTSEYKYRVFTEAYPLPDDVVQLKSARLRDQDINYPLDVFGQDEAAQHQLVGPPSQVASGIPRVIFREQHIHMQGPSVAPVASISTEDENVLWVGPEPAGSFEYKVTYTWGKRDVEFQLPGLASYNGFAQPLSQTSATSYPSQSDTNRTNTTDDRFRTPRFESPASPASNAVVVTPAGPTDTYAVKLSLPNITYALGFLNSFIGGSSRQSLNQSGLYVRIYRKRLTTNFAQYLAQQTTSPATRQAKLDASQLDVSDDFYLLAETRVDNSNLGVWFDKGDVLPDRSRRIRDIHGYQTLMFYPKPDKRYVTEVRAVVRPQELVDDEDTPWVNAEAMNVLLSRAMALFYENLGQPQLSQLSYGRYQEELLTLSKRYGDLRPPNVPVLRRMTRAQSSFRGNRYYRKWWTTSS